MIRNFKVMGLALVAMLALTAVGASAASAAATFTSESESTTFSGSQTETNVFTSDSGNVSCEVASFSGSATGTSIASVTVTPTYSECEAFGLEAEVAMNGCTYKLHASGSADLICSGSNEVEVIAAGGLCTVNVGPQTGLSSVSYTNGSKGGKSDITVGINITNIAYEESGFFCAHSGEATTAGELTGQVTVSGTSGGNATGISWDK